MFNPPEPNIPFSPEAESATLGALLTNPALWWSLKALLSHDDFCLLRHQYIWQAIERLAERGDSFDYLTVGQSLRETDHLDDIGGLPYLMKIINETPTSMHATTYAALVQRAAVRRRLLTAAQEIQDAALDESSNIQMVRETAIASLTDAISDRRGERKTHSLNDALKVVTDQIEHLSEHPEAARGLSTGWPSLDALMYGLGPGQLLYVGGRPGAGKSTLVLNIALNVARRGGKVWSWWGEEDYTEVTRRALARATSLSVERMVTGQITADEFHTLYRAMSNTLIGLPLTLDDTPGLTIAELYAIAQSQRIRSGLDLIVIDRIEKMRVPGLEGQAKEFERITYLSNALKDFARDLDVPVLCAVQLNRNVESRADKHPMLNDLRQSGGLEQDADKVLLLYREAYYYPETTDFPNALEVIVAKHRNGPTGVRTLHVDMAHFAVRESEWADVNLHSARPTPNHKGKPNVYHTAPD